jgi:hypothetical protein
MSFNQYRTNPSQAVGSFKGRSETPKAWPSTAVGNWTNGGLFGGGYVLEDSYKFFSTSTWSGIQNFSNIPQTHRHLYIEFTPGSQSGVWQGNQSQGLGGPGHNLNSVAAYSSMTWRQWAWYMGNQGGGVSKTSSASPQALINYSNYFGDTRIIIYNYSLADVLKPWWSRSIIGQGIADGYSGYIESWGNLQQGSNNAAPAITTFQTFDAYQSGNSSYQTCNIYGFGGLKP